MVDSKENGSGALAIELLTRKLSDSDIDMLLAAYAKGEITEDRIVGELAVRYQRGIGSAVQALAEHNKGAAQQLGERLRNRINEFLSNLSDRDTAPVESGPAQPASENFKDRDDSVLLREYVILKSLSKRNEPLKSATIFEIVRMFISGDQDQAITAHLARMVKAGIIGKERKGRYNAVQQGPAHVARLASEIEARGISLPVMPERLPD